jgi:hypothetical protein
MATLHEYFIKDGVSNLTLHKTVSIDDEGGRTIIEPIIRLHLDFEARAQYVSFYIPETDKLDSPESILINNVQHALNLVTDGARVSAGFNGEMGDARDLIFSGRVFIYSEKKVASDLQSRIQGEAKAANLDIVFRDEDYVSYRNQFEKPRAFISHDSRDKELIAQPLSVALMSRLCPVWYDEFSMQVGDSLRESIETGLKECHKCVLILTPNFLANGGWAKREYDTIFTRELIVDQKVILPVWHNVTPNDIYQYSPILADRVGANWSKGVDQVADALLRALS